MAATRIIGLDPGLNHTGWGIIEAENNRLRFIASGVINPPKKAALSERLHALFAQICSLIDTHQPQEAAVEETFVNKGARSALILGQARGVVLMAPQHKGVQVNEYAANLVKKSVVGHGHADKSQIGHMVKMLLPQSNAKSADEADALAIAMCHAHHRSAQFITGAA